MAVAGDGEKSPPPLNAASYDGNMHKITSVIESIFNSHVIDFNNPKWHHEIPSNSGWYFIETNMPDKVFIGLATPPKHYKNDNGESKKCRNYNIPARAKPLGSIPSQDGLVIKREGIRPVYSGKTKNLLSRAREHTFGHLGTAGLALANYPELSEYKWVFNFLENPFPSTSNPHQNIILKLSEQIWRAKNANRKVGRSFKI